MKNSPISLVQGFSTGNAAIDVQIAITTENYRKNAKRLALLSGRQANHESFVRQRLEAAGLSWCSFQATHPGQPIIMPGALITQIITNVFGPGRPNVTGPSDSFYLFQICPTCLTDLKNPQGHFPNVRQFLRIYPVVRINQSQLTVLNEASSVEFVWTQKMTDRRRFDFLSVWTEARSTH